MKFAFSGLPLALGPGLLFWEPGIISAFTFRREQHPLLALDHAKASSRLPAKLTAALRMPLWNAALAWQTLRSSGRTRWLIQRGATGHIGGHKTGKRSINR